MAQSSVPSEALQSLEEAFEAGDVAAIKAQLAPLERDHPEDLALKVQRARLDAAEGEVERALAQLEALDQAHPGEGLPAAYLGAILVARKQYGRGKPLLEKAFSLGVVVPAAEHAMGVALGAEDRFADALPYLGRAAEKMPTSAPTFFYMGVSFAELAEWADAEDAFARCVEIAPKYVDGWEALARVEVELKKPDAAVRALDEGLVHNPGHLSLQRLKVQVKADHNDPDGALEAILDIPEARRVEEDWSNLAQLCMARDRWADALTHARKAAKSAPESPRTHFLLALALEGQKPMDRAAVLAELRKSVDLGDPTGDAGTRMGFLLMEDAPGGKVGEAIAVLEAARERSGDAPGTLLNLALAYAKGERKEDARVLASTVANHAGASANEREQAARLLKVL
jgi:tetratricopeptide (TPR) repeat protein